jgi:hypothetical protein
MQALGEQGKASGTRERDGWLIDRSAPWFTAHTNSVPSSVLYSERVTTPLLVALRGPLQVSHVRRRP